MGTPLNSIRAHSTTSPESNVFIFVGIAIDFTPFLLVPKLFVLVSTAKSHTTQHPLSRHFLPFSDIITKIMIKVYRKNSKKSTNVRVNICTLYFLIFIKLRCNQNASQVFISPSDIPLPQEADPTHSTPAAV